MPACSQSGYRWETRGMLRRPHGWPGISCSHSIEPAFHGLRSVIVGCHVDRMTSHATTAKPAARTKAPTDESRLSESKPDPAANVKTRRGNPSRPVQCIGRNVALKPMKTSQNEIRPNVGESCREHASGK